MIIVNEHVGCRRRYRGCGAKITVSIRMMHHGDRCCCCRLLWRMYRRNNTGAARYTKKIKGEIVDAPSDIVYPPCQSNHIPLMQEISHVLKEVTFKRMTNPKANEYT